MPGGVAPNVLGLYAAFFVVPVLNTGDEIGLGAVQVFVVLEEVVGGYDIEFVDHGDRGGEVPAVGFVVAVFTPQVFAADGEAAVFPVVVGAGFPLGTDAEAVALVDLTYGDIGAVFGGGYGSAVSFLSGGHDAEAVDGTVVEGKDDVFLIVIVLAIDSLSIHNLEVVVEMVVEELAVDIESQVATVLCAVEGIVAAGEVGGSLGVECDGFHNGGGHGVLHGKTGFELSYAHVEGVVAGDSVVGVKLLKYATEVVHTEEAPAVGDAGLGGNDGALDVEGIGFAVMGVGGGIACLGKSMYFDARGKFLENVYICVFLLCLTGGGKKKKGGEESGRRVSVYFHHTYLYIEMLIDLFAGANLRNLLEYATEKRKNITLWGHFRLKS